MAPSTPVPSRDFAHGAGARPPQRGPSSRPSRSQRPHVRGSMTAAWSPPRAAHAAPRKRRQRRYGRWAWAPIRNRRRVSHTPTTLSREGDEMSPQPEERLRSTARHARNATVEVGQRDRRRRGHAGTGAAAASERKAQGDDEEQRRRWARFRPRRRGRSAAIHTTARRLGSLEYLLLALIVIGVAITIAMAIVDPSG